MKILVRNNNPVKAYKVLTRKLREEGILQELRDKQYFKSKGEQKREDKKRGIARYKKRTKERQALFERFENSKPRKSSNERFRNKSRT
jgi:ribosomal protein S21